MQVWTAFVVREHGDTETEIVKSEQEGREWLVKALYLVEDGDNFPTFTVNSPTPTLEELERYADDLGWTIGLDGPKEVS